MMKVIMMARFSRCYCAGFSGVTLRLAESFRTIGGDVDFLVYNDIMIIKNGLLYLRMILSAIRAVISMLIDNPDLLRRIQRGAYSVIQPLAWNSIARDQIALYAQRLEEKHR